VSSRRGVLIEMAHQSAPGGRLRPFAEGEDLSPAIRGFLDELAEIIGDAILEESASIEDESEVSTEDGHSC